jgi:hypothetical protein
MIGLINQDEYTRKLGRLKSARDSWVDKARIIREIRDRKLYLFQYETFDQFCRNELATGRANADRLCASAKVAEKLLSDQLKPIAEAQVRPLLRLADESRRLQAYREAVARSNRDGNSLTGGYVTRVVREIRAAETGEPRGALKTLPKADPEQGHDDAIVRPQEISRDFNSVSVTEGQVSLTLAFKSEEEVSAWAIGWLRERGYSIKRSREEDERIRPSEFRKRFCLKSTAFHSRLNHPDCPPYVSIRGPRGHVKWIIVNPDLEAWMSRPLYPDRR